MQTLHVKAALKAEHGDGLRDVILLAQFLGGDECQTDAAYGARGKPANGGAAALDGTGHQPAQI